MDFGGSSDHGSSSGKKKMQMNMNNADMQSQYTYNSSEDVSEYDPNRF